MLRVDVPSVQDASRDRARVCMSENSDRRGISSRNQAGLLYTPRTVDCLIDMVTVTTQCACSLTQMTCLANM